MDWQKTHSINGTTTTTTTTTTTPAAAATTTTVNAKINEAKSKIPNITNIATTIALTVVENKMPTDSNLVKKLTIAQKLVKLKTKLLLIIIKLSMLLLNN